MSYLLPAGNVQIAFSGGRTSAYMLHELLRTNGPFPERVAVTFQNTGREMPQTLDFVRECGARWGVKIVWLEYRPVAPFFEIVSHNSASRDGEPFEALIRRRRYLPNQAARFCTIELKVRTAKRYLRSIGWDRWTNCTGIRADEPHRLNKPPPRDRWVVWPSTPSGDPCRAFRPTTDEETHDFLAAVFHFCKPDIDHLISTRGRPCPSSTAPAPSPRRTTSASPPDPIARCTGSPNRSSPIQTLNHSSN